MSPCLEETTQQQEKSTKIETIKCLLVGDSQCGKTSLLQTLATGKFPHDFVPDYHDKCSFYIDLKNLQESLNLNSNGLVIELSDYDSQQAESSCLNLNDFNVVLLCFSFDDKNSFESIKTKWSSMIQTFNKNLAKNSDKCLSYILVGLKSDCMSEESVDDDFETTAFQRQSSIRRSKKGKIYPNAKEMSVKCTSDMYEKYANKIGAYDYVELSAKQICALNNLINVDNNPSDENSEFNEKLNSFLEVIYKSYYFNNVDSPNKSNKKLKNLLSKLNANSSYSRLQAPIQMQSQQQAKQVESVKFKFVKLLNQCKKLVFSCTSARTSDDKYECLEGNINKPINRPTGNKLRNSKIKFPQRNVKLFNAESTTTLNIENDDVFY